MRCTASTPRERVAISLAAAPAMPFPNTAPSGPTSSTPSPAPKLPSQRTTPTASRLLPFVGDRTTRAVVDVEPAVDALAEPQPELERRRRLAAGGEPRPALLPGDDRAEHVLAAACGDHGGDRGGGGQLGGQHLAPHPAAAELGALPERRACDLPPVRDRLGAGRAGPARVDSVHLGQEDEQRGARQDRHDRRESVVVAERDLVGRGRVVLVHDRDRPAGEQLAQGVADVEVGGAVRDLGGGEQDLRAEQTLAAQSPIPRGLEPAPGRAPTRPAARAGSAAAGRAPAGAARARSPLRRRRRRVSRRARAPRSRRRARRVRPPARARRGRRPGSNPA